MSKKLLMLVAITAGLLFIMPSSFAADATNTSASTTSSKASASSRDFIKKASIINLFEVESSKLALDKTQNRDVRKFAEQMIEDHSKAQDKLREAAQASGGEGSISGVLDKKHKRMMDKLKKATADKFDKEYVNAHTKGHEEAISLFKNYGEKGKDASLKDFANTTLTTLENHYESVKQIDLSSGSSDSGEEGTQ